MTRWDYRFALLNKLAAIGVVPTVNINHGKSEDYLAVAKALIQGGIPVMEVLFRSDCDEIPEEIFYTLTVLRKAFGHELVVGCGTLQTREEAHSAINHGAQFVVSNTAAVEVVEAANLRGTLVIPAAETQEEVRSVLRFNPLVVKLFMPNPKNAESSLVRLRQFRGCFPRTEFTVTGGITPQNLALFLNEGYPFVVSGSMVDYHALARGDLKPTVTNARIYADAVHAARSTPDEVHNE